MEMSNDKDYSVPELKVAREKFTEELEERIAKGEEMFSRDIRDPVAVENLSRDFHIWNDFNERLLQARFTSNSVAENYMPFMYMSTGSRRQPMRRLGLVKDDIRRANNRLLSIKEQLPLYQMAAAVSVDTYSESSYDPDQGGTKIFLVHGRNEEVKQEVAEFIKGVTSERPLILDEQTAGGSRTVIEKFEKYAGQARFVVVLLTGDDIGGLRSSGDLKNRARQNVVFELGYFFGRLGRDHVVALYEKDVELPSDVHGITYIEMKRGWTDKLKEEIRIAGIPTSQIAEGDAT